MELFKDIPGYEGYYQVSNQGRVKSVFRLCKHPNGGTRTVGERILRNTLRPNGYLFVGLHVKGKLRSINIHTLVADTFLRKRPNGLVIDHINNIKTDNRLENLQYLTNRQNVTKSATNQFTGVSWHKASNKWRATITINGQHNHLGVFKSKLHASQAYQQALNQIRL